MPQPPPGRPSGPVQRPAQPRPAAAPPPAPASRPVARPAAPAAPPPAAAPARPSSGGTQKLRTPDAPQSTRASQVPQTASKLPAASPGTQRVSKPAAAAPPPAPPSQRVSKPAAAAPPPAPPSQRVAKPAAPAAAAPEAPGDAPGAVPPSKKFLRPTKMQQAVADAANAPPDKDKKTSKKKIIFNLSILLSIPVCIVIIVAGMSKKGLAGYFKGMKDKTVGEQPKPPVQKINPDEEALEKAHKLLVEAQTLAAQAELDQTPDDKKRELYTKAKAKVEEVFAIIEPIGAKPEYQGEGHEYITKDLEKGTMLKSTINKRLLALAPKEEAPPAQPNTGALGALASWNGTSEKMAVIFLGKSYSPTDPAMSVSAWATSPLAAVKLVDLDPARVFEFSRGAVREELEKLQGEERQAKSKELAAGVMVFEGSKLEGPLAYIQKVNGVFHKDTFARFTIEIRDDRGTGAFKEYHDLLLQAIGSPSKGKESVTTGLSTWEFYWEKEGVVYRLKAIGNSGGMSITFTAFNAENHKAFCATMGDVDPFLDTDLTSWEGKSATFPAAEAPK